MNTRGTNSSGKNGITRRTFMKGAAAAGGMGMILATGIPPAVLAAEKKDLIHGIFGGDPGNLSPVIRHDIAAGIIIRNIFDNLVEPNYQTREILPMLAEDWKNVDPLTWRIKLRKGVMWQKGYGEMTAEDLVYTWQFHLDSKSWQVRTALWPLGSFKVVDKYVVEVKLKQPFGAFPGVTMGYCGMVVSKKAHQEIGNEAFKTNPVGNGPFEFVSLKANEIILRKNRQYWQKGLPHLEKVVFRSIPDSHVRLQALQKGELDFISHPDAKDVKKIRKEASLVFLSTPGWNWDYQQFNLLNKEFPYQDKLVRQAISYVMDREAIKEEIYFGEATVTDNQIPFGFLGHRQHLLRYPKNSDLKKAKELMAKAGCKGYEVEVICSDKDWLRRELELAAAMVSQIGIKYKIRNLDMGSFNNLWLNRKFEQLLEDITIVAPDADATVWWFLHSKGSCTSGYNNPEVDAWLDGAREESDPKKREKLYHKIVDQELVDSPMIFHVNPNFVRLHKKGLQGFEPSPQEYIEIFHKARWTS